MMFFGSPMQVLGPPAVFVFATNTAAADSGGGGNTAIVNGTLSILVGLGI